MLPDRAVSPPSQTSHARSLLLACTMLLPALAMAQGPAPTQAPTAPAQQGPEGGWGLGLLASSARSPYAGADRDVMALPLLSYENRWVRVLGPSAEIKLPRLQIDAANALDFRLVAKYSQSGYEADDAPVLNGMDERKDGFWAGGKLSWRNPLGELSASLLTDVSGHSQGQQATLGLTRNFRPAPRVMLSPRLEASWLSKKYVDYYFGVRSGEATPDRAAYAAGSTVNMELGLRTAYLFNPKHSVFLDASVTRLGGEIRHSPLVDRTTTNRVSIGYVYRF